MSCFGLWDMFREKLAGETNADIQTAISSFIFNGADRRRALSRLTAFSNGLEADVLIDLLRQHLEPRWTDPDHAIRERLTIQIFTNLKNEHFLVRCAKNRKLFVLLEYHLRACTFFDVVGPQQLFLARRIQSWLDLVTASNQALEEELTPFFGLQKRYLGAWAEYNERDRTVSEPRAMPIDEVVEFCRPIQQRALPQRTKSVSVPMKDLTAALSQADILCFDILKMLIRPNENATLIESAMVRATRMKSHLGRNEQLQAHTQESRGESVLKGNIVDTIQRLEYCISMVNACDLQRAEKDNPQELLPPVYQYRV